MDPKAFLQAVLRLIEEKSAQSPEGLNAARLGFLLRERAGLDWTEFGYPKLSAVLADLERQGRVKTGPNSKGALSVWPTSSLFAPQTPPSPSPAPDSEDLHPLGLPLSFRRLRAAVWHAFVGTGSQTRRLIHRQSGAVWALPSEPPGDPQQWVEVDSISDAEQRDWAREFIVRNSLQNENELLAGIQRPDWYRAFPQALAQRSRSFSVIWNRLRSQRVQVHVEGWCERNSVPQEIVFEPASFPRAPKAPDGSKRQQDLRSAVLTAIQQMSEEELLRLWLPARQLVEVLRPDLLEHGRTT